MLRKGQRFARKSDGFVFEVKKTGHGGTGALLACVEAAKIFGWYWANEVERDFVKK